VETPIDGEVASGAPVLALHEIEQFRHDGYLVVDRPLVPRAEVAVARLLLAALFDEFDRLPIDLAYDLGDVMVHDGPQQIAEINRPSEFDPRLRETLAFARCLDVARQVLGPTARCVYDHAILKSPHNGAETVWHQDLVTAPQLANHPVVHLWFALQDVDATNGCMRFIPRDGRRGLRPHRPRSDAAHAQMVDEVNLSTAVTCPLRAGMATLHDLHTLHSTGPNTTDEPRLAWILHFLSDVGASA